ncbi:unnamed protein product [Closterium sp. NIES-64]|nr:unnamed protein product [Closterium sp. NIES-64]
MSLYRVRQQRECSQAAATVFPSSSDPRYRCEPHWLASSATAFHELEAPCPPSPPFMARPPSPSRLLPPPLNPAPAILPLAALTCPSVPPLYPCSLSLPLPFPSPSPFASPIPPLSPFTQTHPQAWADAYGLSADSLLPPSPLSLPPSLPPAPHLEDCAALTALRQQAEQRGERGELPPWADPQPAQEGVRGAQEGGAQGEVGSACCKRAASGEASGEFKASLTVGAEAGASASPPLPTCCTCVPQPPWAVRIGRQCSENWSGAEGCVQMTALRSSSRLLLFPSSPRLLVYSSPHFFVSGALGLGVTWAGVPPLLEASHLSLRRPDPDPSYVHIMAVLLSVALSSNRILVPLPASYGRANSSHCHGHLPSIACAAVRPVLLCHLCSCATCAAVRPVLLCDLCSCATCAPVRPVLLCDLCCVATCAAVRPVLRCDLCCCATCAPVRPVLLCDLCSCATCAPVRPVLLCDLCCCATCAALRPVLLCDLCCVATCAAVRPVLLCDLCCCCATCAALQLTMSHGSSWSCFFAPIASPLCSQEVALTLSANQLPPCVAPAEGYRAAAAAAERVVCVNTSALNDLKFEASAAGLWGEAYAKDPDVVELRGEVQLEGTEHKKLHWWRAQAVRFMLRWPSAHLCHVINQQRHTAYGMHVANRIARQVELHSQLQQSLPPLPPPTDSNAPSASAAAEASAIAAAVATAAAARFADSTADSTAAPAAAAAGAGGGGGASGASLVSEPYIVRPIVSMHVRQSDKQVEMGVWSFAAHMLFAARLQRTLVDLKHVWLSTEMQAIDSRVAVINEAATPLYAGWTFLYAANGRLPEGALDPHAYDALQSPAASLASLLIAAQCDVFIGSLGSNWSRLINELRATNGRLYNGFVAMNLGEW